MTKEILSAENIELGVQLASKEEAVRYVGGILLNNGYVKESYIDKMLEREAIATTFMGNALAIPHGTEDAKKEVLATGLSVVTVPDGVDFGDGNIVKLLIGIAGKGDEHLEILSQIAIICSEEENVEKLTQAATKEEIIATLNEVND
ncbi:mannitol-specific phosphotransferase enzyme IIA component [Oceanobacillus oncorhynchi subsp. incaldanensis]|uniref:Mannitol-specific phosphotransferase enzyme IIA component n=2 Tax=Oceanobacillus TaxID=182709 RepID=A0A0A1M743_9BACI|nr:PTS sugar transporter subunit IIA [Oceanobacillus oncorhynchi]MDM8098844.1 PTS sugar transporter subunit IIA [Oceanobacillus oncorhynchi]GIO17971.1 mannitol-specific phosphotransferase enzyme IIA component [Oceanobacillus oncorhynchi subsp. incaldanensis]CEI81125.1 Mannitol-specific phosphotransferase enzyme IIA component [Oceanobacillus oncorhynchi]